MTLTTRLKAAREALRLMLVVTETMVHTGLVCNAEYAVKQALASFPTDEELAALDKATGATGVSTEESTLGGKIPPATGFNSQAPALFDEAIRRMEAEKVGSVSQYNTAIDWCIAILRDMQKGE